MGQLAQQLKRHKSKRLYGYLQKDVKNTVDSIVSELAKDKRIADFYAEWNNINRQKLSIYHDKPDPDIPLEDNKEFRSIKNAIIKAVAEIDSNNDFEISNSKVNNMVTLWVRLLGGMINDSYQRKQANLNNQIDSKLKSKIEQKKLPLIRFHDLRHTFATHAIAGGVDAKTLSGILGHTNASFTLDTYTHVTTDMQKNAAKIVGGFMDNIIGGISNG